MLLSQTLTRYGDPLSVMYNPPKNPQNKREPSGSLLFV